MHVLFVCTGNICRSPTAERLAAARAIQLGVAEFRASSAGTRAAIGEPIHNHAAQVLEHLGGDPSSFAARQFTPKLAADADLILTMTRAHRDWVLERAPRQLRRTFTLLEASILVERGGAQSISDFAVLRPQLTLGDDLDIRDPIGKGPDIFARVGSQIAASLVPVLEVCQQGYIADHA